VARKTIEPDPIRRGSGSIDVERQFSVREDVLDGADRERAGDLEARAFSQRAPEARARSFSSREVAAG
jgi:hypothetical protein